MKSALISAAAASLLLIGAYSWWFQTPWWGTLSYALVTMVTVLSVPLAYRWFGFHDYDAISSLHKQEQLEHTQMLEKLDRLETDLNAQHNSAGASQASTLMHLLNDFHEVIANRFGNKHLSASSYLSAARRVQNQALQNISDMVGIGHSIASLERQAEQQPEQQETLTEQRGHIARLQSDNQKLFKALTDTSVEVANIQELGEFERTETLARLKDLSLIARQQGA